MKVSKNITIDLNNPRRHVVHLMESGNQREIILTLLKDGMPFDVSEGIGTATLVKGVGYIKANGVPGYYDWTSTDMAAVEAVSGSTNKWTVRLDEHATDVPGFAQIFVKFSLASGETLYSFPITLNVSRTSGGTTDPDSPWYHSSSFILAGAQSAKTDDMNAPIGIDANGKLWFKSGLGWTAEAKVALLDLLAHVPSRDENGPTRYAALVAALDARLESIEAVYTQSGIVYDTASLNSLKADLIVYATYNDGTVVEVVGYTLSGNLEAGISEITVTFGGKTDTFEVTVTEDPLPSAYRRIEYVERPTNANANTGYNTTGFTPNGTDDLDIKMGVMCIQAPTSTNGGYFLICRQTTTNNTVGFGVYVSQNGASIGTFDGQSCLLTPPEIVGQKFDLTVLKTSNGCGITDGIRSNSVTGTPRAMASPLYVFAMYPYTGSNLAMQIYGRIYYLNIKEGGVEKVNFIPCKRRSDNAIGFYNTVAEEFKTSSAYVAGPEV